MAVSDGQTANAANFNAAFMDKNADTGTTGVVDLNNSTDVNSGAEITNVQRYINELADTDGVASIGDANRKVYSSSNVVAASGDNRKVAIGKIDAKFHATTGHKHTGVTGDGSQIAYSDLSGKPVTFARVASSGAIADNSSGTITDFNKATAKSVIIMYRIIRGTANTRVGSFIITINSDATLIDYFDGIGQEIADCGVTLSADLSGAAGQEVRFRFTSTSTGTAASIIYETTVIA